MQKRSNLWWSPVTGAVVTALAVVVWQAGRAAAPRDYSFFDELVEVRHLLANRYITTPDTSAMREGAIRGMVEALDDPYTVYVPASEQGDFNKSLTGEYVGIGAQISVDSGWLTIVSPLEDSPAFRAGLMPDDRVAAIDGVSTQNMSVRECTTRLTGTPGTPVLLTIERDGRSFDVTVVRDRIKTRSVKGFHREADNPQEWDFLIDRERAIGYIRVTQFTPRASEEVAAALATLRADRGQLKGLVLDLRFNPGGLLEEAIAIADMFLREGVIVSTKGRAHEERVARARAEGTLPDFPIAVLLNTDSASASEILAGALQDNNRAIVVGTRSFGKGSVQSVIPLQEGRGSELKITEQGYYLPSGRSISRADESEVWGVDPSPGFFVPMSDEDITKMLTTRRRLELLAQPLNQTQPGEQSAPEPSEPAKPAPPANWEDLDWALSELSDPQLTAAVRAVQTRVDTGAWAPASQDQPQPMIIAGAELTSAREYRERVLRELSRVDTRIRALERTGSQLASQPRDLWPDTVELDGGELQVRDSAGNVVTRLRINGNALERWLIDANLTPLQETTQTDTPAPARTP